MPRSTGPMNRREFFRGSAGAAAAVAAANFAAGAPGEPPAAETKRDAKLVRDILWVWGNPEMTRPGPHTAATFANASPAERAQLLGIPNVMMAGPGLPNDDAEAEALTKGVAHCQRILWEIAPDGDEENRPFVYEKRIAQVRRLADRYPNLEGVILDDMSTVARQKGFKPEHIRAIRRLLGRHHGRLKIWGVVYTMSLADEGINDYVKELDVIMLAVWHARDVANFEKHVAHCERLFPGKPIVGCFYLYDYGDGRRMPQHLLEEQCELALKLAHAGRIVGIEFTSITNDAEAVGWAADWVKRVGDEKLRTASSEPEGWISLFDGKSLKGWHKNPKRIPHGTGGQWAVEDGVIAGEQDPPGSGNGGILVTDQKFGDFELLIDMKIDWGVDSGVFLRSNDQAHAFQLMVDYHDHGNVGQVTGHGISDFNTRTFEINGKYDGDAKLIGLTTAKHRSAQSVGLDYSCMPQEWLKAWKLNDWNTARVRAEAKYPRITTWINGVQVCIFDGGTSGNKEYDKEEIFQALGAEGSIALQVYGGAYCPKGSKCRWKNIKIREL